MQNYIEVWLHIIALIIVFAFTTFYALHVIMLPKIFIIFKIFAVIVIIAVLYLAGNSNTYLPFLGYCAMPPSLFSNEKKPDNASETIEIDLSDIDDVPDGTRVIYWGAMNSKDKNIIRPNPIDAYGSYLNSGISIVKDKKTTIYYLCPDRYNVGMLNTTVDRHIHYRLVRPNSAIISPVFTKNVKC